MQQSILIVGASARAAAWSALRAGDITPYCIDLFADADLRSVCSSQALAAQDYPDGFVEAARTAPPGPWIYTGALENHPKIIDALARERPLWGNPGHVIRKVRSPERVRKMLTQAGIPCPAIAQRPPVDNGKSWLVKRKKSAGGAHVRAWHGQALAHGCYLQEQMEGIPCSAQYVGASDGSALFLGATKQLVGVSWLNSRGFHYCGNIGPLRLSDRTDARLRNLGDALVGAFGLRGLFGVDFILQGDNPWPVEINPRYTAGLEILERANNMPLFALHWQVFEAQAGMKPIFTPKSAELVHGKAILYAKETLVFSQDAPVPGWNRSVIMQAGRLPYEAFPDIADVPVVGARIEKGRPIVTLFAEAPTEEATLGLLRKKIQALDRRLFGP